jgi:hypothetical protein
MFLFLVLSTFQDFGYSGNFAAQINIKQFRAEIRQAPFSCVEVSPFAPKVFSAGTGYFNRRVANYASFKILQQKRVNTKKSGAYIIFHLMFSAKFHFPFHLKFGAAPDFN